MKLWGYSNGDNLKNRRNLAMLSAVFALVVWPHELIILHLIFGIELDLIKAMLVYIGTLASGSIGGYIWSAMKESYKNVSNSKSSESKSD